MADLEDDIETDFEGDGLGVIASRLTTWATKISAVNSRSTTWKTRGQIIAARPTSWGVQSLAVPSRPAMQLRVYSPNGATIGTLPAPESINASYVLDDLGAVTFEYSPRAPRSSLLGQPCEIAVELSPDNGISWYEPINSRFVYLSDGLDPLQRAGSYSVEARGYVWRLSKALVYGVVGLTNTGDGGQVHIPENDLPDEDDENAGKRPFLSCSPGMILKTLLGEAQTRGALSGIDHSSFSAAADSAGRSWAQVLTIYYEPGINLLTVLQDLNNQGFVEFRMQGRSLQVFNSDQEMAKDRDVTFRPGRDLTEAPFRRTWEALADTAIFSGGDGAAYIYTNPSAIKPWGRQELFISNGSVTNAGTMAFLTQQELSTSDQERTEYTHGLDFARATALPFLDYSVGDYVNSTRDGQSFDRLRVRQITLTRDNKGAIGGNIVLNDRFIEADLRARRRIEGITNGASGAAPGDGGTPATDKIKPAKVTGLTGFSAAYMAVGGFPQALVELTWTPVTTNFDGTNMSDFDHYEIRRRPFGSAITDARLVGSSLDTTFESSGYVPNSKWWFSVRCVDNTGNRGDWSAEVGVTMAHKTTPPVAPTTPVATAKLGMVSVHWDGQPSTGSWDLDFYYVEVHMSIINDFTPDTTTIIGRLYGEGTIPVTDQPYGIPLFFKLVAVDTGGLRSIPSGQATGTPTPLVGTDLDPSAITFDQIAFKDVGNLVSDGSFETAAYRSTLTTRSNAAWTWITSDHFHGDWSAQISATSGALTQRLLILQAAGDDEPIKAGEKLFCRFAYNGVAGSNGALRLVALWTLQSGATTTTFVTATLANGTWQQTATQITAPANTAKVRFYVELSSAADVGAWEVDAVEIRRTVNTAIIEDAAITNALIANLAVNSAKIADLEVGKITGGTITADVLMGGAIRTASAGSRLEMTGTGLRMYNAAGILTGHWDPSIGQLRIYNTTDASHTSTGHGLQFGVSTGTNLVIDNNEIMCRNNGSYGELLVNREGGIVRLGGKIGGFNPDGSDDGVIPQTSDHLISLRGYVQISNVADGEYIDNLVPLLIGKAGGTHLFFDSNEIGASDGSSPGQLYLNPPRNTPSAGGHLHHVSSVVLGSNSMNIRRAGDYNAGDRITFIGSADGANNIGIRLEGSQVSIKDGSNAGWQQINASNFNTVSQAEVKEDREAITDPIAILKAAKSERWQYKAEIEAEDRWHYGPMLEDLPVDLRRVLGRINEDPDSEVVLGYDIASLVGILWAAVDKIFDRFDVLPDRVQAFKDDLQAKIDTATAKFDVIDTKLSQAQTKFGQLDAKDTSHDTSISQASTRFTQLTARIAALEAKVG